MYDVKNQKHIHSYPNSCLNKHLFNLKESQTVVGHSSAILSQHWLRIKMQRGTNISYEWARSEVDWAQCIRFHDGLVFTTILPSTL